MYRGHQSWGFISGICKVQCDDLTSLADVQGRVGTLCRLPFALPLPGGCWCLNSAWIALGGASWEQSIKHRPTMNPGVAAQYVTPRKVGGGGGGVHPAEDRFRAPEEELVLGPLHLGHLPLWWPAAG